MDLPLYLRVLWSYKWLLLVGMIVAAFVGGMVGYTYVDGQLQSRTPQTYKASTTVLVSSSQQPLYRSVVPGAPVPEGVAPPVVRDMAATTVVYAYLVSGSEIRSRVDGLIGPLTEDEQITAIRRTTQPGEDEDLPGLLVLPILDIVGSAQSPARAEEISRVANSVFQEYLRAEQDINVVPEGERVQLQTLRESGAIEAAGSNPLIPVILTAFGVLLLVVVLIFMLYNVRVSRERRRAARRSKAASAAEAEQTGESEPGGTSSAAPTTSGRPDSSTKAGTRDSDSGSGGSRDDSTRSDDTPAYV